MTPPRSVADAFEQYGARVESVAAWILRDREEARDVAADTFLALLERGPDDDEAIFAWLLRTARNRALNRARDRARAVRRLARHREEHDEISSGLGDEQVGALLAATMERLSARDRAALRLRYEDELGHDAVGVALGVTAAQARVVVHRAARRLRREAVALLAERHAVPEPCKRVLLDAAAHDSCEPCARVGDEIHAMAVRALTPPALPLLARMASRLPVWHRSPHVPRLAEAVAVLAITTGMAFANTAAPSLSAVAARASVAGRAAGTTTAVGAARAAHPISARSRAGALLDRVIRTDEDPPPILPEGFHVLGVPVSLPDALTSRVPPGADIRALELGTVSDATGHAAGLLVRIHLGAHPMNGLTFTMRLDALAPDCSSTFEIALSAGTGTSNCWHRTLMVGSGGEGDHTAVKPAVGGNVVQMIIAFHGLGEQASKIFAPGARLTGINLSSSTNPTALGSGDSVPDSGPGYEYTIAR